MLLVVRQHLVQILKIFVGQDSKCNHDRDDQIMTHMVVRFLVKHQYVFVKIPIKHPKEYEQVVMIIIQTRLMTLFKMMGVVVLERL